MLASNSNREISVKITDFGLTKQTGRANLAVTQCGSLMYMAPELLKKGQRDLYTNSVDIWAAGIIMYQLLCAGFEIRLSLLSIISSLLLS